MVLGHYFELENCEICWEYIWSPLFTHKHTLFRGKGAKPQTTYVKQLLHITPGTCNIARLTFLGR